MRLSELQSVVCRLARRLSGYLRCRAGHPLHHPVRPVRADRPPIRQDWVHSLVFASPLRSISAAPSGRLFRAGTTLPGSLPSPRHHRAVSTRTGDSTLPLRSVLGFSQPLDGLLHRSTLRAYCIPLPRPGFSPFRGFSHVAAVPDSSSGRAPLPLSPHRSPASRLPRQNLSASRLCSATRCVPPGRLLIDSRVAPLFGFRPPAGLRIPP
jgi:hypothetical protein